MRVPNQLLFPIVNYIKGYNGFESESPLQFGTQYVVNGVVIDIHFSTKNKPTFSLDVKNQPADPIFVQLFEQYIGVISVPADQGIF